MLMFSDSYGVTLHVVEADGHFLPTTLPAGRVLFHLFVIFVLLNYL